MGNGFNATPQDIANFGSKISKDFGSRAAKIASDVQSAEVPVISWGLLGQTIVWPFYKPAIDAFIEHVGQISDNAQHAGDKFSQTAQQYQTADQGTRDDMNKIAQELKSNTLPDVKGK